MNKDAIRNEVAKEAQEGEGSYLHGRDQPLTGNPATPSSNSSMSAADTSSSGPAHHRLATVHSGTSLPHDTDLQAAKQGEPQCHGSDEPADHGATIDVRREAGGTAEVARCMWSLLRLATLLPLAAIVLQALAAVGHRGTVKIMLQSCTASSADCCRLLLCFCRVLRHRCKPSREHQLRCRSQGSDNCSIIIEPRHAVTAW